MKSENIIIKTNPSNNSLLGTTSAVRTKKKLSSNTHLLELLQEKKQANKLKFILKDLEKDFLSKDIDGNSDKEIKEKEVSREHSFIVKNDKCEKLESSFKVKRKDKKTESIKLTKKLYFDDNIDVITQKMSDPSLVKVTKDISQNSQATSQSNSQNISQESKDKTNQNKLKPRKNQKTYSSKFKRINSKSTKNIIDTLKIKHNENLEKSENFKKPDKNDKI